MEALIIHCFLIGGLPVLFVFLIATSCWVIRCRKDATASHDIPIELQQPAILIDEVDAEFKQGNTRWAVFQQSWPFLDKSTVAYSEMQRLALMDYLDTPSNWSISWHGLLDLQLRVKLHFGEENCRKTMYDVVDEIIRPSCARNGAPIALVMNEWQLKRAHGYVIHTWQQPFQDLMSALEQIYCGLRCKPSLFISACSLFQYSPAETIEYMGESIKDTPFALVMEKVDHITVVQTHDFDVFARGWCLIELTCANKLGFFPSRCLAIGPDTFSNSEINVLDAKCSSAADQSKILEILLREGEVSTLNESILQLRNFTNAELTANRSPENSNAQAAIEAKNALMLNSAAGSQELVQAIPIGKFSL